MVLQKWTNWPRSNGLSAKALDAIRPNLYVNVLTAPEVAERVQPRKVVSRSIIPINVNTATAETFQQLPGIGEILSRRIVKYRTSLGGFQRIDQLKNVYQLQASVYEEIEPYLFIKRD